MFKIITLVLLLLINGCALTEQSVDHKILVNKKKTIESKAKPVNKKLTDSNNKEDDNLFEFLKLEIDKAINFITREHYKKQSP